MEIKGVTITILFQADSANYGNSMGNIATLKKVTINGKQHTYISRQCMRYDIIKQLGEDLAPVTGIGSGEKQVIQFAPDATIKDYPEIDFFGYMKTVKGDSSIVRDGKVRLSHAISLSPFMGENDFLTNKNLADRNNSNMNIAQSEIHNSYYRYTVTIDLDKIGIDKDIEIENSEKSRRVCLLIKTIMSLYRDIKGRREDLKPIFVIGGVYDRKNPTFQNIVNVRENKIITKSITSVLEDPNVAKNTICGLIEDIFSNDDEIRSSLTEKKIDIVSMYEFEKLIQGRIKQYYECS